MDFWTSLLMLAQEAAPEAGKGQQAPAPFGGMLIMLLPIVVIWFVMFILPQNKEKARRQEMLKALKKNDSVVTIGGIIGTVSHVSEDGSEVTVRVDDNTRLKFQRDAIRSVVTKDTSDST